MYIEIKAILSDEEQEAIKPLETVFCDADFELTEQDKSNETKES